MNTPWIEHQYWLTVFLDVYRNALNTYIEDLTEGIGLDYYSSKVQKVVSIEEYFKELQEKLVNAKGLHVLSKEELNNLNKMFKSPIFLNGVEHLGSYVAGIRGEKDIESLIKHYQKPIKAYLKGLKSLEKHTSTKEQNDITNI